MFNPFRKNAAVRSYRRTTRTAPTEVPDATALDRASARRAMPPAWAAWPTVAVPRPGRAGWLTPAQTWRANGGRW